MSVLLNYVAVILIWSTTPLAIKVSSASVSPFAAILYRMTIAFFLAAAIIAVWKNSSTLKSKNWKVYVAAGMGIFPNMTLVYLASNFIASGLMAVLFALTPITSGLLAAILLKENYFTPGKLLALIFAIIGVVLIFMDQLQFGNNAIYGIVLMLGSGLVFSLSQVLLKHLQTTHEINAFEQTFGALAFSLPGLLLSWFLFDDKSHATLSDAGIYAIIYLSVIGSLIGFAAYFFVLSHLSVSVVSLIPLVTPVLALYWGALLLNEPLSDYIALGTACIVVALILYDELLMAVKKVIFKQS